MALPCCWPPSDTPPATPLRVDAGPDNAVEVDTPLTLAGSASGGTPPYIYQWEVISAPDGGIATFVDGTDPTTDVSFDTAGVYVLQLTVTDSVGSVAGDTVTETVSAAPAFPSIDFSEASFIGEEHPIAVAYSPDFDTFVLVTNDSGTTGKIYTSADGLSWQHRADGDDVGYQAVAWCPVSQVFLACAGPTAWVSFDGGISWNGALHGAPFCNGAGEAVDGTLLLARANQFKTSIDSGVSWVDHAAPTNNDWLGLATKPATVTGSIGGGGSGDASAAHTLDNGATWTGSALPGGTPTTYLYGAAFCPELAVFAGVGNEAGADGVLWTSPDAVAWTQRTVPSGDPLLRAVAEVNRAPTPYVLACGTLNPTNGLAASYDGVTWFSGLAPADGDNFCGLAYSPGSNLIVLISFDGGIWLGTPA